MFEILPRDSNLKPIFTQKWASVDMNWGVGFNPPTIPTLAKIYFQYPIKVVLKCTIKCERDSQDVDQHWSSSEDQKSISPARSINAFQQVIKTCSRRSRGAATATRNSLLTSDHISAEWPQRPTAHLSRLNTLSISYHTRPSCYSS